jgi:hypothetical protein
LRLFHHARHVAPDQRPGCARVRKHLRHDVAIEHALHRNAVHAGFDRCDAANCIDQRVAMVRTGAAHQCPVDIEQYQRVHR